MRAEIKQEITEALNNIWDKYMMQESEEDADADCSAIMAFAMNAAILNPSIQSSHLSAEDCRDIYNRFTPLT